MTEAKAPHKYKSGNSSSHFIYDFFRFLNFLTEIPKYLLVAFLIFAAYKIYEYFKKLGPEINKIGKDIENEFEKLEKDIENILSGLENDLKNIGDKVGSEAKSIFNDAKNAL